jgi:ATP-dependent helicase HrpB
MSSLTPLPIDPVLPELLAVLARGQAAVLEAPPGTGKTTRVPRACLDAPAFAGREILVLEPRRLAAKLAAIRVADELGEDVGETVGYHFRFENVGGPKTRIRFYTEGMFLRRLLGDPTLRGVGIVIVDEFHERHLQGDLALALVRRLQTSSRPDLKVVVMSATLDGAAVAAYLGCPALKAEGRRFPVDIEYLGDDGGYLDDRVARAVGALVDQNFGGDMLVFLPGVGEIRRAEEAIRRKQRDLLVLPLYADLPRKEQDQAVRPAGRQKVVLATNVAETSITIEGVTAVIDGGLARIASHNVWSGLPVLRLSKISQASATQRAGRAGRTAPGRCLRLYGAADFQGRPSFETPEIQRLDLAQPLLELKAMGAADDFPWFAAPPPAALEGARELLYRLGALAADGALTPLGRRMAGIPAHPRLARVVLEAERLGVPYEGATLAAWLGESPGDEPDNEAAGLVDAVLHAERGRHNRIAGWQQLDRARQQLLRGIGKARVQASPGAFDEGVRRAVLAGFPDRLGRLRTLGKTVDRGGPKATGVEVVLAAGGSARLMDPHLPTGVEWVTALDASESTKGGLKGDVRLNLVGAVDPDWLLDLEPMGVDEVTEAVWNADQERAEIRSRLQAGKLVISESHVTTPGAHQRAAAETLLAQKAKAAGLARFADADEISQFLERVRFLRESMPDLAIPAEADFDAAFWAAWCAGKTRFAELREHAPLEVLRELLPGGVRNQLDKIAPATLQLPGGRRLKIHYEPARPPWAESRLQDFFGMRETPKLAAGRLPLVLHLLAPNHRALQVTTDLAGFWVRTYPELRKELSRRYPRHSWPDDPFTAEPPKPRPPRR